MACRVWGCLGQHILLLSPVSFPAPIHDCGAVGKINGQAQAKPDPNLAEWP